MISESANLKRRTVALGLATSLLACTALLSPPAHAQNVADVLRAFRKLGADCEAGVNYTEYVRSMAEANSQLKIYADSNPGKPPGAILALRSAFDLYLEARDVWDDQQLQAMRYNNGELAISVYFDGKRAGFAKISALWKQAGEVVDRAASLQNPKQRTKAK